uniref:Transmembrane protein 63A n=1 Tax=Astatotilapia calliptera TaxID=8154 RepID=A0AAX7TQX8_ASTCA
MRDLILIVQCFYSLQRDSWSTPVMKSLWWEQESHLPANRSDGTVCFNSTQSTVLKGLEFGGVPAVLLINFVVFVILLIIFTIIRKQFWDYGRLALVADDDGSVKFEHNLSRRTCGAHTTQNLDFEIAEYVRCDFVFVCLCRSDEKIKAKCGMDAVHYLSYERHLIYLLVILTVLSIGVILPVNMTGGLLSKFQSFGETTIGNLKKGNNLLWLHTVFAVIYLILTALLLQRHVSRMKGTRREIARNTLFVCSLPKEVTAEDVKTHFVEAYPSCQVCAVTLAYNVTKLMYLDKERIRAGKNLCYYEHVLRKKGERVFITPRMCGYLCCCVSCVKVSQLSFTCCRILKDFNAVKCGTMSSCCGAQRQPSSKSQSLKVNKWRVGFAPYTRNVYWENLSVQGFSWYARYVALNLFLFILLTLFTTPTIIINTMDKFNVTKPINALNSPIISQFFPTFLLWAFSALLPTIVYYSTLGEAHWSRSSEQLSMMRKLYFFLLFMVLLLPSLGLTSLAVFFQWLFDKKFLSDGTVRFECVFLPDQGAFFVNYVIAAALVGSAMELLRLPGLLLYVIRLMIARSAAERKYVKENQAYEFEYGAMYGWILCLFTVILAYSIICPVIVPFGLIYMVLKYLVDRYNLCFVYLSARLDRQVHLEAVNQALGAPIICLIWLYFFSALRMGFWAPTSLFTLVVLCITIIISLSYTCFGFFKYLSPLNYVVSIFLCVISTLLFLCRPVYLPRVLNPKSPASIPQNDDQAPQSYGSFDDTAACSFTPVDKNMEESNSDLNP